MMMNEITIRPEEHRDYKSIVSLILRSFREGTDYSDGTDIIATPSFPAREKRGLHGAGYGSRTRL